MEPEILLELFGYLGSTLVVVSMLMASVVKLRIFNMTGSVISATYALIIGSFPLALMNISLILINGWNLYRLLKNGREYDLVCADSREAAVQYFLNRYREDIRKFFPDFVEAESEQAYMVFCNGSPAGILLGQELGDGCFDVSLDYAIPAYRDCSVGKYLYSALLEREVLCLTFSGSCTESHENYLKKMGFSQEDGVYARKLR
jgi:hypothetical protein